MVWVNTETKVFHREGDQWYGKTKHGKYMTQADAERSGYRESEKKSEKNPVPEPEPETGKPKRTPVHG
jgi:hypothetical protein